jgi:hypothetical protein
MGMSLKMNKFTACLILLGIAINLKLNQRLERHMAVTREQFDAALKDGIATIINKIDDLAAKVAAGQVTTPEDFQAELDILKGGVDEALSKDPDTTGTPAA